ncbi:MAG: hypothetical protein ACRC4M_03290, partial [Mycoplasma sp.]
EYILETPRTNVLSLDLTVDKYTEEGSTGETVTLVTPTLYEGIKIENLRIPEPTIVDIKTDVLPTVTSTKIRDIIESTEKNPIKFQENLSTYFDFSTYPDEAKFIIDIIKEDKTKGYLEFHIKTDRWIDDNKVKQKNEETFIYKMDNLKESLETVVAYHDGYNKDISAQELVEIVLDIVDGSIIKFSDIKDHPISEYIDFFTYPLDTDLNFSRVKFNPANGTISFSITIERYIGDDGNVVDISKTLDYNLKVNIIPNESVVQYVDGYFKEMNPQELTEYFEIEEGSAVSDDSRKKLKEFIDFKTFPKEFGLTIKDIVGNNVNGTLDFVLVSDAWFQKDRYLNTKEPKPFSYRLNVKKQPKSTITSKAANSAPKGIQPSNFKNYLLNGMASSADSFEDRLRQFVNLNAFPKDATFSAIVSTDPDPITGRVGLTVTASQYHDDKGYKQSTPKTFDEVFITIPMVNDSSEVIERDRIPKNLKPETLANFILENKVIDAKEGEGEGEPETEKVVNVENLNKIFKINELFPMIETAAAALKDDTITPDPITKDTQFKITDNTISVDGKTVTFFLEANQVWNESGFFQIMPEDSWASFKVELEFPGAYASWVIIGSSIGGAIMVLLIILAICNKSKFKALITNKF